MVRQIRVISIPCIFLLCSFFTASGNIFSSGINDNGGSQAGNSFNKNSQYYFSGCSFHHTQPADTAVNISCAVTAQAVKNHSLDIIAPQSSVASTLITALDLQYQSHCRYIEPGLTSIRIIFPFHYFW